MSNSPDAKQSRRNRPVQALTSTEGVARGLLWKYGSASNLQSIVYSSSLVILLTSLVDLFITRLVFRAGPDFLSHVAVGDAFYLALIGRISITLEQLLLFVVLASATILLLSERDLLARILGVSLIAVVASAALLYAPLPLGLSWATSILLVSVVLVAVPALAFSALRRHDGSPRKLRLTVAGLLGCVVLSFIFPLYYRLYLLLGAARLASLPMPLEAYLAGIYSIMAAALAAFAYALQAPSPGFSLSLRNFLKAAVLPTVLVLPMLYGLLRSFFMTQIFTMIVAMSTDIILSHELLKVMVVVFWFFLTAVLVLFLKGHYSGEGMLRQEAIGLVLLMSTAMLFNYPYYLMLGIAGVLLLCYPIATAKTAGSEQSALAASRAKKNSTA